MQYVSFWRGKTQTGVKKFLFGKQFHTSIDFLKMLDSIHFFIHTFFPLSNVMVLLFSLFSGCHSNTVCVILNYYFFLMYWPGIFYIWMNESCFVKHNTKFYLIPTAKTRPRRSTACITKWPSTASLLLPFMSEWALSLCARFAWTSARTTWWHKWRMSSSPPNLPNVIYFQTTLFIIMDLAVD